jgi:hypothetical protein
MFNELQAWWQNTTPEMQAALREGSLALGALLGGYLLGSIVARALRARNFDVLLRLPGSSPPAAGEGHGFTPTFFAGILVRLTVWAAAAAWLARQHDRADLASTLGLVINRAWALAAVLVAALALGSLVAGRVIDCLKAGSEARNSTGGSLRSVAGALGAAVYGLVVLLALLLAADFFDWPLTRSAAQALWQFAQHLLIAGAALLMGRLGAGWARDLAVVDGTASPEKRAGHYTGLALVTASTAVAITMLLSTAGVLFGLVAVGILGLAVWSVRNHLPDVAAGLQLRAHQVQEVWFEGALWQVGDVGLLTTEVSRAGEVCRVQNRLVLEARLHGAPAEVSQQ